MEPAPAPLSDWLAHALRLVAVERRERVLVLGELPVPALLHLARACGESGRVVAPFATDVACPRHPALVCVPIGSNASVATGAFDVVFAAPAVPPDMPPATLLAAARSALRPGGRLLVDLPARLWSDDFVRLQPLLESYGVHLPEGSDPSELRRLVADLGLRQATVTPRTCLQPLHDVEDLLDLLRAALDARAAVDFDALRLMLVQIVHRRGAPPTTVLRRCSTAARR